MLYRKLNPLPLGSIKAEGFLRDQLLRNKDGIGGHLDEIEPEMIWSPYVEDNYVNDWSKANQAGWGAEISGNYWTGLIMLAYTLGDKGLMKKAEKWVNAALAKQRPDGYLGTYRADGQPMHDDFNAGGNTMGYRALLTYYEATGRQDVFDAVYRCMLWFCENWAGDKKTCYAGIDIIDHMVYCYEKTGDERLKQFAIDYVEFLANKDMSHTSYKVLLDGDIQYTTDHTVHWGIVLYKPAIAYQVSGEEKYLKASENGIKRFRERGVHPTGGPVSVAEFLGPVSATAETEYCSFTVHNRAYSFMASTSGKAIYGDYMEEIVYNGAQGGRLKNERAIAYCSAPNQVFANTHSTTAGWANDMQAYAPCYPVSCCPVNSVIVIPEFVKNMAMTNENGDIYITAYGPCSINSEKMKIKEETLYPFRNNVTFKINGKGNIYLKKPVWAKGMDITLNSAKIDADTNENGYVKVNLTEDANEIRIDFKAEIEVLHIDDSEGAGRLPLAFKYGALVYSLKIEPIVHKFNPKNRGKIDEEWTWYDLEPYYKEADVEDSHERTLLRRNQFSFNVAVDGKITADDVKVVLKDTDGYAWESPYIALKIPAYKAPYAYTPYPTRTVEVFEDTQVVTDKLRLELVPYGCTNLRITYFPRARV